MPRRLHLQVTYTDDDPRPPRAGWYVLAVAAAIALVIVARALT